MATSPAAPGSSPDIRSPNADADPHDGRDETETERLDRNWTEILQELRVLQTGTQILTGFLLTLAFQARFDDLNQVQIDIYLVLVIFAVLATVLGLAPVSLHRILFRRNAKEQIVHLANVLMRVTLATVAIVLAGTVALIFDVVVGSPWGILVGGISLVVTAVLWLAVPTWARASIRRQRAHG